MVCSNKTTSGDHIWFFVKAFGHESLMGIILNEYIFRDLYVSEFY